MSGVLTHIPLYSSPKETPIRTVRVPLLTVNGRTLLYVTVDGIEDGDYGVIFEPEQVERLEELRQWALTFYELGVKKPEEKRDAS